MTDGPNRPCRCAARCSRIRRVGAYHHLSLVAPGIAEHDPAGPVRRAGRRRARTPACCCAGRSRSTSVSSRGVYGGTVEIVFAVRGAGHRVAGQRSRSTRRSTSSGRWASRSPCPANGSARRSSAAATAARRCSASPRQLHARGCRVDFVLGAGQPGPALRRAGREADGLHRRGHDRRRLGRHSAAWSPTCCPQVMRARRHRRGLRLRADGHAARPSPPWPASIGVPTQCAVEESMACGIGVCMTCVLPVARRRRRHPDGALLRRRPGLPRRPGPLGRRRHRPADTYGAPVAGVTMTRFRSAPSPRPPTPHEPTLRHDARRSGRSTLPNPVLTASGCAAAGRELDQFLDVAALGAVVTKSIMLAPRSGRATPRMAETPSGMLNSIGLQGPGIEHFLDHDLPWLHEQRRARGRLDRRRQRRGVRRAGPSGCAARPA